MTYKRILMIKSHSMGVGDVLRSSAAWRVMKNKWPQAHLHLLFLSKHAGYPTEDFIRQHHLLASATFLTIREGTPADQDAKRIPLSRTKKQVMSLSQQLQPDLVIDFEASGIRSSMVTRWAANAVGAKSAGIGQFLGRRLFYDFHAPSVKDYALKQGLQLPMDYTERDFVVLAALGLYRNKTPIELLISKEGRAYKTQLELELTPGARRHVIGLNIGCGTSDAIPRRPPIQLVAQALHLIATSLPCVILLTGAVFEKEINQTFIDSFQSIHGAATPVLDCSGQTCLSGLTGLVDLCDLFISSDSGPYHMAVAMQKPTLAWFMVDEPAAYHDGAKCKCLIRPGADLVADTAIKLLNFKSSAADQAACTKVPSLNSAE
jgi:ADP-heptose:LPS heptosyltransferase